MVCFSLHCINHNQNQCFSGRLLSAFQRIPWCREFLWHTSSMITNALILLPSSPDLQSRKSMLLARQHDKLLIWVTTCTMAAWSSYYHVILWLAVLGSLYIRRYAALHHACYCPNLPYFGKWEVVYTTYNTLRIIGEVPNNWPSEMQ